MKSHHPQNSSLSKSRYRIKQRRRFYAEMLGTFMLTFVAAGGHAIEAGTNQSIGLAAKAIASGLLVMVMIYTLGEISGAHFNPIVTFAFALRREFPWRKVLNYWLAQIIGALVAVILLRILFGNVGNLGATLPDSTYGAFPALVIEIVLTCLLVLVILGAAKQHHLVGANAAIAVGGAIALCGLFASPISGASMNPARSIAPALISGNLGSIWIYILGPFLGAISAVALTWVLHGNPNQSDLEAGSGEDLE